MSLLLAALDEKTSIGEVCRGLQEVLSRQGIPFEILVVDDGSVDGTGAIAREAGATVITHPHNKGYGASLKTGARQAKYETLVTFDADGQHDPADVLRLLGEMESGRYDMVVGARGKGSPISRKRAPGKKVLSWVANYLAGTSIPDLNSGLRAVRREVFLEFIHILPNQFSLTTTITLALLKAGYIVGYIPVVAGERVGGSSSVNVFVDGYKTLLQIVNTIVLFDPNRVFIPASLALFLLGVSYGLYTVVTEFNIASGSLLLIITALITFFFGIIADQLSALRRERK